MQGYLTNNTVAHPKTYSLVVTSVGLPRWNGLEAGVLKSDWDVGLSTNWIERTTGLPTVFGTGNPVQFDDSATGTNLVTLTATVDPVTVVVNNTNINYTIKGSGKITGNTGLSKQGPGALTISSANDFTGPGLASRDRCYR